MKSAVGKFWWTAAIALLSIVPCAFAQNTVDVTDPGNFAWDGVYVSPYYATVNGAQNTTVICDDFADDTKLNTTWTANATSFSSLASNLGNTLWGAWYQSAAGGSIAASTIVQWYDEAAWLTLGMLAQPANSSSKAYYSYAIWAVFDPNSVLAWLKGHGDTAGCQQVFGNACTSTKASVGSLLYLAQQNYGSGNYSNLVILSPTINGKVCTPLISGSGNCASQEFFMMVPEGGAAMAYLLLAALSCFGAMFFRRRVGVGRPI